MGLSLTILTTPALSVSNDGVFLSLLEEEEVAAVQTREAEFNVQDFLNK